MWRKQPDTPGYYWWRMGVVDTDLEICRVSDSLTHAQFLEGEWPLEGCDGEWQPVVPPTESPSC